MGTYRGLFQLLIVEQIHLIEQVQVVDTDTDIKDLAPSDPFAHQGQIYIRT